MKFKTKSDMRMNLFSRKNCNEKCLNLFRYVAVVVLLCVLGGMQSAQASDPVRYGRGQAFLKDGSPTGAGQVYVSVASSSTSSNSGWKNCTSSTTAVSAKVEGASTSMIFTFQAKVRSDSYKFTGWYSKNTDDTYNLLTTEATYTVTKKTGGEPTGNSDVYTDVNCYAEFIQRVSYSFVAPEHGVFTITNNGTPVSGYGTILADGVVHLVALPDDGYRFAGWFTTTDGGTTKGFFSFDPELDLTFTTDVTVGAVFMEDNGSALFYVVNGGMHNNLPDAITEASSRSPYVVKVAQDGRLVSGNYTIPSNVTLFIPYNKSNATQTTPEVVTASATLSVYRRLTMMDGANITCNGSICVGGKIMSAGGGKPSAYPTGPCGMIDMSSGGHIDLNSGAKLYCWGFIKGQDMNQGNNTVGVGSITAKNNSEVWEMFAVGDWRGGTACQSIYNSRSSWKFFPFQSYTVQNIEVPVRYEYGAKEQNYCNVFGDGSANEVTFPLIAKSGSLFIMNDAQSVVRKWYDPTTDLVCYELSGTANIDALNLSVMGINIGSSDYNLPITSNMHIILTNCNMTLSKPMIVQPGAVIEIKSDASLTCSSKAYLFDNDNWGLYCNGLYFRSIDNLTIHKNRGTGKSKDALDDARLIVNGALNVTGSLYTSSGGADIMGDNAGTVSLGTLPSATNIVMCTGVSTNEDVAVASANLHNEDGSYTKSIASKTFHNRWGRWFVATDKDEKANHTYAFTYISSGAVSGTTGTSTNPAVPAVYAPDQTDLVAGRKWCNVEQDATCSSIYNATQSLNGVAASDIKYTYKTTDWLQLLTTETANVYGGSDNNLYAQDGCTISSLGSVDEDCLYEISGVKKALVDGFFVALEKNENDEAWHNTADVEEYYVSFTGCVWHHATKYEGEEKAYVVEEGNYIWYNNDWLLVERESPYFYVRNAQNVKQYYTYENNAWVLASPCVQVTDAIDTEEHPRMFYFLPEALTVAFSKKNATIKLLKDVSATMSPISCTTKNTTYTWNLNGHKATIKVTGSGSSVNLFAINMANGTFTITDESDDKDGQLEITTSIKIDKVANACRGIAVLDGSLVLEAGTVKLSNTYAYSSTSNSGMIKGIYIAPGKSFTMEGGAIYVESPYYARAINVDGSASANATVTLNAGTITANTTSKTTAMGIYSIGGTTTIKNGVTINATTKTEAAYGIYLDASTSGYWGKLNMTGGEINATATTTKAYGVYVGGTYAFTKTSPNAISGTYRAVANISGGTFNVITNGTTTAYGVLSLGTTTISNATFNVTPKTTTGYGLFVQDGTTTVNSGTFNVNATATAKGIYANGAQPADKTGRPYNPNVIVNNGTFNVTATTSTPSYGIHVDCNSRVITSTEEGYYAGVYSSVPTVTIHDGVFDVHSTTKEAWGAYVACNYRFETGTNTVAEWYRPTLTINDGTFEVTTGSGANAEAIRSYGITHVNGGDFTVSSGATYAYGFRVMDGIGTTSNNPTFTVNATTTNAYGAVADVSQPADKTGLPCQGDLTIGGGTFTVDAVTSDAYGLYVNASGRVITSTAEGYFPGDYSSIGRATVDGGTFEVTTQTLNAVGAYVKRDVQANRYVTKGELTINDGDFTVATSVHTKKQLCVGIWTYGTTTVNGGTFDVTAANSSTVADGYYAYGLYALDGNTIINNSPEFTVKAYTNAYGVYANADAANKTTGLIYNSNVTINGGTYNVSTTGTTGAIGAIVSVPAVRVIASGDYAGDYYSSATMTINNGTFNVNAKTTTATGAYAGRNYISANTKPNTFSKYSYGNLIIHGGEFNVGTLGTTTADGVKSHGMTTIDGGTFNVTPKSTTAYGVRVYAGKTTINETSEHSPEFNVTATTTAYGVMAGGGEAPNNKSGLCYNGEVEVNAGTFNVETTSDKPAYGVYVYVNSVKITSTSSGYYAGNYANAGIATINGGEFNVTSKKTEAYGIVVPAGVTQSGASAYPAASATPECTVNGGKFWIDGTADKIYMTNTKALTDDYKIYGGYYGGTSKADYGLSKYANPVNKQVITLNDQNPNYPTYLYKVGDGALITWKNGSATLTSTPNLFELGITPVYYGETPAKTDAQYTYTFDGWSIADEGDKLESLPAVSADATYYAHYTKTVRTYTVSIAANDAEWGQVSESSVAGVPYGTAITTSENTLTVNGTTVTATPAETTAQYTYAFDHWETPASVIEATNVQAVFTRTVNPYEVTFDLQGHGSAIAGQTKDYGSKVTEPEEPTETGWTFGGWYKEAECTNAWDFASDEVQGTTTLFAKWTINTHKLTWDFAGGSTTSTTYTEGNDAIAYGTSITYPANNTMTKANYVFSGWSTNAATMPDADLAITAQWTPAVASVTAGGTTYYTTLQAAFDYAADKTEPTITVLDDIALSAKVTYTNTSTTTVTFDLNGYKVSGASNQLLYLTAPSNAGKFIIKSSANGGQIYNKLSSNSARYCVYVHNGTMDLQSGTIYMQNTNTGTSVCAYAVLVRSSRKFNMTGGKLEVHSTRSAYAVYSNGITTISRGNITAEETSRGNCGAVYSVNGTTTISDGVECSATGTNNVYGVIVGGAIPATDGTKYNGTLIVEGGSFKSIAGSSGTAYGAYCTGNTRAIDYATNSSLAKNYADAGTLQINGGVFTVEGKTTYGVGTKAAVSISSAKDADGNATYATATATPKTTITGGKFHLKGTTTKAAVTTSATNANQLVQGGWYNVNTNLSGYIAPTKSCNYWELPLTGEEPYLYEVAEAYTVTFNTNGHGEAPDAQLIKKNGAVTEPIALSETGYTFGCWYKEAGCTNAWNFSTDKVTTATTLYAKWTPIQYTISFDSNGGSEVSSITQDYNTSVTAPADPTKTGYTFAGWSPEVPSVMPAEDTECVAQWTINQYTISFDSNGGSEVSSITQDYNTSVTAPADPTKTGYTFAGWSPEVPSVMPAEDTECVAQWTINQYTISFDSNGGSEVSSITQDYNTSVTAPADPTKTGYTFAGWSPEVPSVMPAEDTECVAQWTPNTNTAYTVNHYQQNVDGTYPDEPTDTDNETGTTDTEVTPAVKNYTGFTAPSTQTVTILADGSRVVEYYYTRDSYTLTWNANGGELSGSYTSGSVKFGASITAPTASRANYDFDGWHDGSAIVTPATTMPAANTTYTAQWSLSAVTILWKNGDDVIETDEGVVIGSTPSFDGETPTKTTTEAYTYTFDGWTTEANGGGTFYAIGELPAVSAAATYYAHFTTTANVASVKVGSATTYYTTIDAAFAHVNTVSTNMTITLLADATAAASLVYQPKSTYTCTLDLNNHTISGAINKLIDINLAKSTFIITDNSVAKGGSVSTTLSTNARLYSVFLTAGTLKLQNGKIYANNPYKYSSGKSCAATGVYVTAGQTFTMENGTVESEAQRSSYAIYAPAGTSTITINGGLVKGHTNSSTTAGGILCYANGLTINGGRIIGHSKTSTSYGLYLYGGSATLNGGTIEATNDTTANTGTTTAYGIYVRYSSSTYKAVLTVPSTSTVEVLAKTRTKTAYAVVVSASSTGSTIAGGTFTANAKSSGARGIHGEGNITISGGTFNVRTATTTAYGIYSQRGKVTVNGNPTFNVTSGTTTAYGALAYGIVNAKGAGKYSGTIEINGGTFNVTSTKETAYGAYAGLYSLKITQKGTVANDTIFGQHYMPGILVVNDGTFNVKATTTGAFGIVVAKAKSESGTVGTTARIPKGTIKGGKFKVESMGDANATAYAMNSATTAARLVVQGGYYNTKRTDASETSNIEDKYTAPTKDCNYYCLATTAEDKATVGNDYNWKVAEAYMLTWILDGGKVTVAGSGAALDETGTLSTPWAVGDAITAPTVTKTDYTFNGWSPDVAATMPASDKTYTATWTFAETGDYVDIVDWTSNGDGTGTLTINANGWAASGWPNTINGTSYAKEDRAADRTLTIPYEGAAGTNLQIKVESGGSTTSLHNYKIPYINTTEGAGEEDIVYVNSGLTIDGDKTLAALYVRPEASVDVASGTLTVGKLVLRTLPWQAAAISGNFTATETWYTRIAPNNRTISGPGGEITYESARYYQFALPLDCTAPLSEIQVSHGANTPYGKTWLLKYYSEESRSTNGASGDNWVAVAMEEKEKETYHIQGGVGYEMSSNSAYYREFYFPVGAVNSASLGTKTTVSYHESPKGANHAGWNIICSPLMGTYENKFEDIETALKISELQTDGSYLQYAPDEIPAAIPFSYQAGKNGVLDFSGTELTEALSAPRRRMPATEEFVRLQWLRLFVKDDEGHGDETSILSHPTRYEEAYKTGIDVAKQSFTASRALIYSSHAYGEMAFAGVADSLLEKGVALTIYSPSAQSLTISMRENNWLNRMEYVWLIDKETGIRTDLLTDEYSFYATEGTTAGRFFIEGVFAPKVTTDLQNDGMMNDESRMARKLLIDDKIYIDVNGRRYDATGKLVNGK